MESKFSYQLTHKAAADLDDIVSYLTGELAKPKAAADFVDKAQAVLEKTRSFPESGSPVVNEFLPVPKVRKDLVDNYIIYYLPDFTHKVILVLRIVYGRRNMAEILRQL